MLTIAILIYAAAMTLAFGALMPGIVALQFVAKVAGGALWAALLARKAQRGAEAF